MQYEEALALAEQVRGQLAPHCERIEIAGSIRRKKPEVKDIELVAIPKPYDTGLFESGVAAVVNAWPKVKGTLPCKYTQRILPGGMVLDLFFADRTNWGLIYAIRTGSAAYSHEVLAKGWVARGYHSSEGRLLYQGKEVPVLEEEDLFRRIGIRYVEPEYRNL